MFTNQANRWIFDRAPARWIGRLIYDSQRRHQPRTQSATTKFFRNLQQLAALEGPLANLTRSEALSILVVGCSYGCEAYSLGGLLALRFPQLNWRITAVDISHEALKVADAAHYTSDYGLGSAVDGLAKQLEAKLFDQSGDEWTVVADIRKRVSFAYGDVLSEEFRRYTNFDLVLGQNFMIHMDDPAPALASLVSAARSGGVLFLGGMDLETKTRLLAPHKLVPLDWNIAAIHDEDEMRRSSWPWHYWSLEPINRNHRDYLTRYSTIFFKP